MIIGNLIKLIGLVGTLIGIEIIAIVISFLFLIYMRNQQAAAIICSFTSISMTFGLIGGFLKWSD